MTQRLRRESPATSFHPGIDRSGPIPAVRQLYLRLRDAIMEGVLEPGSRLPSTRVAAVEWTLSRGLVAEAYDLLIAEGYAESRHGSGTYVISGLPPELLGRTLRAREDDAKVERRVSVLAATAQRYASPLLDRSVAFATGRVVHDARTAQELGRYNEKQSYINVALSLIMDGIDDVYDWAYLIGADSDQAATARVFKERFPNKKLALVAPPNRFTPEKALPYADIQFSIARLQMERAILPQYVPTEQDRMIRRPADYDPPPGWLHPNDRRKRKR